MKKKLIEVALPLEAINVASAREKSIRHGHPSTLHLWWARRPLAACRAVLFASLVDDPSSHPEQFPTEDAQEQERQRLFRIIEDLVKWENSNNEIVLNAARQEILKSTDGNPPPVYDPFCGGGSIPLEAQRLGLEAHASDLNPVAVLITKALIEIPPKFANQPPINPEARRSLAHSGGWRGAQGLAEDVRYYGKWMRDEAAKRIGHLYPKVKLPDGKEATVIAWLWARTVQCPNPACGARMPMVRSFVLSSKKGHSVFAEPILDLEQKTIRFEIRNEGNPQKETTNRTAARCLFCSIIIKKPQLRAIASEFRVQEIPFAVVCESDSGRAYFPFKSEDVPKAEKPSVPALEQPITNDRRWFSPPLYGLPNFSDLFTARQLVALTTFSKLVSEAREEAFADACAAGMADDGVILNDKGAGATAYADAVAVYLALGISRLSDICNAFCRWENSKTQVRNLFGRQAIPMVWDYAEPNLFAEAAGDFGVSLENLLKALKATPSQGVGNVKQLDATSFSDIGQKVVSTDPPYYDNIGYADLSDFFYIWLRQSLSAIYPNILSTLLVPKSQELVATPHRFEGSRERAKAFFEDGFLKVFSRMRAAQLPEYPLTVYYAFKQAEEEDDNDNGSNTIASTGWETMLEGMIRAGFTINGTWPMRSELSNRMVASGTNALASSIILVCRPRPENAPMATRREFLNSLKRELPDALRKLQHGNIAPVDLAQAAIGPGMAVFSRYSKVVESDGAQMRVRTALQLINQALDAVLAEQESDYDADTRWALAWFEQFGINEGPYGIAETLSKAKNTSVHGLEQAGIVKSGRGKVRLLTRGELTLAHEPGKDQRLTVWEVTQQLIRALDQKGESGAAELLAKVGSQGGEARDLAYRLYTTSERKGWAQEALAYNSLVVAWSEITRLTRRTAAPSSGRLFE